MRNWFNNFRTQLFKIIRYTFFRRIVPFMCFLNRFKILYGKGLSIYVKDRQGKAHKKCIIVGTGPSLRPEDIIELKSRGYEIFGVNGLIKWVDQGIINIDYFVLQDYQVFAAIEKLWKQNTHKIVSFIGTTIKYKRPFLKGANIYSYPLNMLDHYKADFFEPYNTYFSDNAKECVYDGYTVVYSAVQIAYSMGYTRIGLLGIDAGYSDEVSKRNVMNINKIDPTYKKAGDRINYSLGVASDFLSKRSVELVNYTRGGNLNTVRRAKW
jgi:hypothetical protein